MGGADEAGRHPLELLWSGFLERTALTCPVHQSLHQDVDAPIKFVYPS